MVPRLDTTRMDRSVNESLFSMTNSVGTQIEYYRNGIQKRYEIPYVYGENRNGDCATAQKLERRLVTGLTDRKSKKTSGKVAKIISSKYWNEDGNSE